MAPTTHLAPDPILYTPSSSVFDLPTSPAPPPISSAPSLHPALQTPAHDSGDPTPFLVISGGTGCNAICAAFAHASYVLPVSDDGGSSAEIIRVLGGPSIGDIRSRLVRLIPSAPPHSPLDSLRVFLAHRLPSTSEQAARDAWRAIVEGRSALWAGIPSDRKEAVRGFLVYFESEVLRRAHKSFSFLNGSIGNYFLAAAQGFFRSLPSAIFLFSSLTGSQASILPAIVTNHTVTIAAELTNGAHVVGQCEISHPVPRTLPSLALTPDSPDSPSSPTASAVLPPRANLLFAHDAADAPAPALDAPIARLYYINAYGHEIHPAPNAEYLAGLRSCAALVYAPGSLWTSIMPCLALRGVAGALARSSALRAKIFFLNAKNDRETAGYTAEDYIAAIARTLNAQYPSGSLGLGAASTTYPVSAFVTHMVYLRDTRVAVDVPRITALGVRCVRVESAARDAEGGPLYDAECARRAIDAVFAENHAN